MTSTVRAPSFGDAIAAHPKVFPGYYIAVIRAAELTGRLDSSFEQLAKEVDLVLNFHIGPRSDILTGYCYLFGGDFLRLTGPSANSSLGFVQYQFRW